MELKKIVKKLFESKKTITKSSQLENLAKCRTNSTSRAKVANCRISRPCAPIESRSQRGRPSWRERKFSCQKSFKHIFLDIPLLSGTRLVRVVTSKYFSAFTAQHELLCKTVKHISFYKPFGFYEKPVSTTVSLWKSK